MLMMGVQVDGLRKHPNGRVDQLEDRYLGMVEAPSSNLGTDSSASQRRLLPRFLQKAPELKITGSSESGVNIITVTPRI